MKDYKKSDYALNKNGKGIVYRNADGSTLEITFEKVAEGNPEFTYEDFKKLKQFSDQIYLEQVKADNAESYYVKTSLDVTKDSDWLATPTLEETAFKETAVLPDMETVRELAQRHLTEIQKRRFLMYLEGVTMAKIAEIEGVRQNAIWESIMLSRKKLRNLF